MSTDGFLVPSATPQGTLTFHEADLSDIHTVTATLTGASWADGTGTSASGSSVDDLPPEAREKLATALQVAVANDSTWTGAARSPGRYSRSLPTRPTSWIFSARPTRR